MIPLLAILFIGLVVAIARREFVWFGLSLVLAMVSLFIQLGVDAALTEYVWKTEGSRQLVHLTDKGTMSGGFLLGCGIVRGDVAYYYYLDEGNGVSRPYLSSISDYPIWVKETEWNDPKLWIFSWRRQDANSWLWCIPFQTDRTAYQFDVPKGTIKHEFRLDGEG